MKQIFLVILIAAFSGGLYAQGNITFTIDKVDAKTLTIGETISVDLHIKNLIDPISLFQFYVEFDQRVLKFVKSTDINEAFKMGWKDNLTEHFYASVFLDMSKSGQVEMQEGHLCTLQFKYLGGETDLNWGDKSIREEGRIIKGETKIITTTGDNQEIILENGCVCN